MIDFLIEYPTATREEMALHFGVTRPWLSTIIHSQAFQAALKHKQDKVFNCVIARPLQERLLGAAHLALDRLEAKISTEEDTETLRKVLETLGRGAGQFRDATPAGLNVGQINLNHITVEDLRSAREMIGRPNGQPALEHQPAGDGEDLSSGGTSLLGARGGSPAIQAQNYAQPALPGGDPV